MTHSLHDLTMLDLLRADRAARDSGDTATVQKVQHEIAERIDAIWRKRSLARGEANVGRVDNGGRGNMGRLDNLNPAL